MVLRALSRRTAFAAILLVLTMSWLAVGPAVAAPGDPQYLSVTKTVDNPTPDPGESFVYTVRVTCSEASCLDAQLTDALPPELAGYTLESAAFSPSAASIPRTIVWTVDGTPSSAAPAVVTSDTVLTVDFTGSVTAPSGTGLQNGQTFTVLLTLSVPSDLAPGTTTITNTASTTATNSADSSSSAPITVTMQERVGVGVTKTWTPATQAFETGRASAIALTATSTANVNLDSLVLQEPQAAPEGAASLAASNPFEIVDFASMSGFAMPSGASTVRVDAYVLQGGTWGWVTGTPDVTPALPAGVTAAEVGGVRFVFEGDIAPGASGAVTIGVGQRATDRSGTDLSTASHTVTNVVVATASAAGHDPVSTTASAPHTVNPATVAAATSKSISPARIAAGDSAAATILATNDSDVGVAELRAADLNYFTEQVTFGGFSSAIAWPAGTASAQVVYHPLAGGADEVVAFADGGIPADPSQDISGFEVVFASPSGSIAAGATATLRFAIDTTEAAVGAATSLTTTNAVSTTVTALNGLNDEATDSAGLVLLKPAIDVTLDKTILPSTQAMPGDRVVTRLDARMTTTSDYVTAHQLVVGDSWSGAGTFWDAFTIDSIAPTQVPADTSLTIDVLGPDRATWTQVSVFGTQASAYMAGLTQSELVADVAAATSGAYGVAEVTGVRFTFDNVSGFAGDVTVSPYVVSRARATLRESGQPTSPAPSSAVTYGNVGSVAGSGTTRPGTPVSASATGVASAPVVASDGSGSVGIGKAWNQPTVPAQSDASRTTALTWSVVDGFESVTIADAQDATAPQDTVYDAFDLVSVQPILASSTPFTNGWYLRYDSVSAVELWIAGAWVTVPEPGGGWISNGRFVGYTLSASESANATGFRIVLEENATARAAAAQSGAAYDPYAPEVGSGVAASSADRTFTLTWRLRDKTRVSDEWATNALVYNATDPGVVSNTATMAATPIGGGADQTASASDSILLTNPGPGVTVTKAVTPSSALYVPSEGTPASSYPTATFTVVGRSNSTSDASYVRIMDSPVCADGDPIVSCESAGDAAGAAADPFAPGVDWLAGDGQGNPFDRFNLEKVTISASIASEVDLGASVVWLLHYDGAYSTTSHTATAVNGMAAAELADVVGVSVAFQDTDPAVTGGSITAGNALTVRLDTRLRTHFRVNGEPQVLAANNVTNVPNRAFAQSYDPILNDGVQTGALASANVRLTGGDINVGAVKGISPSALTEPMRHSTVTVTLGANQGTAPVSTLAPAEVRLTDDVVTSPDFWNTFTFTGLGTLTAPAGADQVSVSVYGPFGAAGAMTWVAGAPSAVASATVPVASGQYADVQGIRLAFSRVDGGFFSDAVPAAAWSTSSTFTVALRDTYRDSGLDVNLSGTVDNTVVAVSDRLNGESSVERAATAQIALSSGTFEIEVNKLANEGSRTTSAGSSVPWDLTFTNSGTGYLTITELRDILPASLVYLGDTAPVYTPDAGGTLGAPASMAVSGGDLVFLWPGGGTMTPGETFSVRLMLELQPGLSSGQRATNEMRVTTVETLAACVNIDAGGATTSAWGSDPTTCGTTDYVTPSIGPNLFTVKGVRGAADGAVNPTNLDQECVASLEATGGSYYRAPCAANSAVGATDSWVLRAQNAGTTGLTEIIMFDALPAPADTYLISGLDRGSDYRPQMLDDLAVTAPIGAVVTVEVTSTPQACQGTWAGLEAQEPCAQNGEVWSPTGPSSDWSAATAFRITVNFAGTMAGMLSPGEFVDATFSTQNVPASASSPDGAPVAVPVAESFAWNQFGVKYLDTGASAYRKIAPARMGIRLGAGTLDVTKERIGSYVHEAPTMYSVDVACTVAGAPVVLGSYATLALTSANAYTQQVSGIPDGSSCTVSEPDLQGATDVTFDGAGVTALGAASASVVVGASGADVTVINHFDHTLAFTGAEGWRDLVSVALALVAAGVGLGAWARRRSRLV